MKRVTLRKKVHRGKVYGYDVNYGGEGYMFAKTKREARQKARQLRRAKR